MDVWAADFPDRFARFAGAVARVIRDEAGGPAFFAPVNEPSFLSFAGGELIGMCLGDSAPSIISSRSGISTRPASQLVSMVSSGTAQIFRLYGMAKCFAMPAPHTL